MKTRPFAILAIGYIIAISVFFKFFPLEVPPKYNVGRFATTEPLDVVLKGSVVSDPETSITYYGKPRTRFILAANHLFFENKDRRIKGLVQVDVYGPAKIDYADQVVLKGRFLLPKGATNPGQFDYKRYLAIRNIYSVLKVNRLEDITGISKNHANLFIKRLYSLRHRFSISIDKYLPATEAAILKAMFLGECTDLSYDVRDYFTESSTAHILAISGLHVGLIAFLFLLVFKILRIPYKVNYIFTIILLVAYAILVGARPSVVRATLMAAVILIGLILERNPDIMNVLGFAAVVLLIKNPKWIFDTGFQLSFMSVLSIIYFSPKLELLWKRHLIGKSLAVSTAAWLGVAPIILYDFHLLSPIGIIANLVVVPLGFLSISSGLTFIIATFISSTAARLLAAASWAFLTLMEKVSILFSSVVFGHFHFSLNSWLLIIGYYIFIMFIFNYKKIGLSMAKVVVICLILTNVIIWQTVFARPSETLDVTIFDVGDADAIFIKFPKSGNMLIDTAGPQDFAARNIVLPYLYKNGIGCIDTLVITHPDDDHIGGAAEIIEDLNIGNIFDSGVSCSSQSFHKFIEAIKGKGIRHISLKEMDKIEGFNGALIYVLNPPRGAFTETVRDANNNSVVLKIVYKDTSILLCGDIEEAAIERLINSKLDIKADIVKIPHHGRTDKRTLAKFLMAISPEIIVNSASRPLKIQFPETRTLLETSRLGAVIIRTDGSNIKTATLTE